MAELRSLQYVRALAATSVVLYHGVTVMLPRSQISLLLLGEYGVDLFFVLSGFLMAFLADGRQQTVSEFMRRRIVRVVPLYWICTLLIAAVAIAWPSAFRSTIPDFERLTKSLLFVPHWHRIVSHEPWPILIQGWTLNLEMFFYVVFAAAMAVSASFVVVGAAVFLALCVLIGILLPNASSAISVVYGSPLLLEFIFGLGLATAFRRGAPAVLVVSGAFFLVFVVSLSVEWTGPLARALTFGTFAAALIGSVLMLEQARRLEFDASLILLIGDASYSIYLTHAIALGLCRYGLREIGVIDSIGWQMELLFVAIATVMALILGVVVHRSVERPILARLRK